MNARRQPVIDLVYFNAGGGHRATAEALQAVVREQRQPWEVRLVNLVEVLDPLETFRRTTGFAPEDIYNKRLKRGWTLGLAQELKLLQGLIRLGHTPLVRQLQQHWLRSEPDLVVSLIPNFNRALCESLQSSLPGVPYVTVLTDLADLPPSFWIERGQSQHFVCGTARAVAQARAAGHPNECIHATSGMILRPDFYRAPTLDRDAERRRMGLDPALPTGIVLFGGHGSRGHADDCQATAERATHPRLRPQRAADAQAACSARAGAARVLGYTGEIAKYMRLADFFIGKPGPGSLSEALQVGLPVIVARNAWTMPQERYNTDWVRDNGVGVVHVSYRSIGAAIDQLLGRLEELRANVRRLDNRAVFEVPEILADVLHRAALGRTGLPLPMLAA